MLETCEEPTQPTANVARPRRTLWLEFGQSTVPEPESSLEPLSLGVDEGLVRLRHLAARRLFRQLSERFLGHRQQATLVLQQLAVNLDPVLGVFGVGSFGILPRQQAIDIAGLQGRLPPRRLVAHAGSLDRAGQRITSYRWGWSSSFPLKTMPSGPMS